MILFKIFFLILAIATTFISLFFIVLRIGLPKGHELSQMAQLSFKFGLMQLVPAVLLWTGFFLKSYEVFSSRGKLEFASILLWMPQMFWLSVLATALIFSYYGIVSLRSFSWSLFLM